MHLWERKIKISFRQIQKGDAGMKSELLVEKNMERIVDALRRIADELDKDWGLNRINAIDQLLELVKVMKK